MRLTKSKSTNDRYTQCLVLLMSCFVADVCVARSQVTRIEVSRGEQVVASLDGALAAEFTIWSGPGTEVTMAGTTRMAITPKDIADWESGQVPPPVGAIIYVVAFHCEPCEPARAHPWRCYGVRYAPGENGGAGLIQIPAAGDPGFPGNLQTIYRGVEGQWFRASEKWESLVGVLVGTAAVDHEKNR